jgi:deoxyxylulose-5-phosphate synthase
MVLTEMLDMLGQATFGEIVEYSGVMALAADDVDNIVSTIAKDEGLDIFSRLYISRILDISIAERALDLAMEGR